MVIATLAFMLHQQSKRYGFGVPGSRNGQRNHSMTLRVGFDRDLSGKILDTNPYLFDFGLQYKLRPLKCHDQLETEARLYRLKQIAPADVPILILSDPAVPVATIRELLGLCAGAGFREFNVRTSSKQITRSRSIDPWNWNSYFKKRGLWVPDRDGPFQVFVCQSVPTEHFADLELGVTGDAKGRIQSIDFVNIVNAKWRGAGALTSYRKYAQDLFVKLSCGNIDAWPRKTLMLRDLVYVYVVADPHLTISECLKIVKGCTQGKHPTTGKPLELFREIILVIDDPKK
jgi:hypothetical protein